MYTVLIVQIPPNEKALVNDSKFKNLYPIYGLKETKEITSTVLSDGVQGLYLFGTLSHGKQDGDGDGEKEEKKGPSQSHRVTFKMLSVVGINSDFVATKRKSDEKLDSMLQNVTTKIVSLQCSQIKFVH